MPMVLIGTLGLVALALSTVFPSGFEPYFDVPFDPAAWINRAEGWLRDNYRAEARAISSELRGLIRAVEDFLIARP